MEDPDRRTRRVYSLTESGHREYARVRELMRPGFREALGVLQVRIDTLFQQDGTPDGQCPGLGRPKTQRAEGNSARWRADNHLSPESLQRK